MSRSMLAAGAVLAALAAVLVVTVSGPPRLGWYLAAWALFGAALWAARRLPERRLGPLVLAGGIVLAATGLTAAPSSSTDSFRYVWDGRVQAAGISPYAYPPSDPALAGLRDPWLFPQDCEGLYPLPDGGCTRINRPTVPTIYPPLAQGYFLLVHWLSPEGAGQQPLQVAGFLLAVGALFALHRVAGPRRAAAWAWCPAVPVEAVNNAHVDMLGVLLVVLAFSVVRGRGALLGAAVAAKLLPVTALPGALAGSLTGSLSRRRALTTLGHAGLVVVLSYVPYVPASGPSLIGYLPGYLKEERYDAAGDGNRYAVLRLLLPDSWAPYAAIVLLAAVALLVLRYGDPERPWDGALLVSGAFLLLLTPGYSWYALLVVALAAMAGRLEWLGTALAGAIAYADGPAGSGVLATAFYTASALAVMVALLAGRPVAAGLSAKE
ncbi:hypothetical protein ABZW11_38620 [Nonomuraea sp. NPDC004580]|uniref:hypothetical protein n=1 Tax=Nonomuraea sp. NPDC004580 TaxID=3154552 RepID=UPI0033A3F23B